MLHKIIFSILCFIPLLPLVKRGGEKNPPLPLYKRGRYNIFYFSFYSFFSSLPLLKGGKEGFVVKNPPVSPLYKRETICCSLVDNLLLLPSSYSGLYRSKNKFCENPINSFVKLLLFLKTEGLYLPLDRFYTNNKDLSHRHRVK